MFDRLSARGGKPASSFAFLAALGISVFVVSAFASAAGADTNTLVSKPLGSAQNGATTGLFWDRNGRHGVFISSARNLVENQDTHGLQVFFHDRVTGRTRLVSHVPGKPATGANAAIESGLRPQISADGNWVLYSSAATDLVAGQVDVNFDLDVFLWSRGTGQNFLVSHRADAAAITGNFFSRAPSLTSLSDDGRFVAYSSAATDLIAGQATTNFEQVYLYDHTTGASVLVSHAAGGPLQSGGSRSTLFDPYPGRVISGDGRWIVFITLATDLASGVVDTNGQLDAYLWDRQAAPASSPRLLSRRTGTPVRTGNGSSSSATISADGSAVVFISGATDLEGVTADSNGGADVFHYDRLADVVELVSHVALGATIAGNGQAGSPSISGDGRRVAFRSGATNHVFNQVDGNGETDVFLWQGSTLLLMSHRPGAPREAANGGSFNPLLAEDGSGVAFDSAATDLVAGPSDSNGADDVFWRPRGGPGAILLSHVPSGAATGDDFSQLSSVAVGGELVAFSSFATNLVEVGSNLGADVLAHGSLLMADGFESGNLSSWSLGSP